MKMSFTLRSVAIALVCLCATAAMYAQDIYVLNPEPGVVTKLSQIIIKPQGDWGLGSKRSAKFTLTGPEGVTIPAIQSQSLGAANGYLVTFADNAEITTDGTYIFTIPAGKFAIDDVDCPAQSFEYTIQYTEPAAPEVYDGEVHISPALGTYNSISEFSLTFDAPVGILDPNAITLTNSGNPVVITVQTDGNSLIIKPGNDEGTLTNMGIYVLTVGKGALAINGKVNPELTYRYNIGSDDIPDTVTPVYTITPASGSTLAELSEFTLVFSGVGKVQVAEFAGPNDFPRIIETATSRVKGRGYVMADRNTLTIHLYNPVTEDGEYTLVIPSSLINLDGSRITENIEAQYTVDSQHSGVTSISADTTTSEVITISGRRMKNATGLPAGIYIINGKKAVVK